jgi:hypothetical protein
MKMHHEAFDYSLIKLVQPLHWLLHLFRAEPQLLCVTQLAPWTVRSRSTIGQAAPMLCWTDFWCCVYLTCVITAPAQA